MSKIKSLTAAQERQLVEYREMWLERGRSTAPANRPKCEAVWAEMYKRLGKPTPRVMWWDGPATGSLARAFLTANLCANLGTNLGENLWANLGANLGANLRDNLCANLGENLVANLGTNLWDNLGDNLCANLGANLGANLWENLWENLWDNLRDNLSWYFWGRHEAYWPAFYAFSHEHLRNMYDAEQMGLLDHWLELAEHAGWWEPFEGVVMACEPPEIQEVDEAGRLHREDGPAILCRDGWPVYAWHGVRVPAHVIEQPHEITVAQIDNEQNAEVRRVMLERYGTDRYLLDSHTEPHHTDNSGALYRREVPGDEPLVMVRVQDPSTDREYFLRVPPTMQTARQAVAWTFDMEEQEYQPEVET